MESKAELGIFTRDPWLENYREEFLVRHKNYTRRLAEITAETGSLRDFANGHYYFGFTYSEAERGWWFREWLPGAQEVYLFGDFNAWNRLELKLTPRANGQWELFLPDDIYCKKLTHGSLLKMRVHGPNGWQERIPSYIRRVIQDPETKNYTGQFWNPPTPFDWKEDAFDTSTLRPLLLYEAHVGMALETEEVGTYHAFEKEMLPRIKQQGYNAIQLMAIAEHPYYGSFGYQVSNFFAPTSRFGTPEELKALVRKAHRLGIAVIMDLVHAHYVKNIQEGLNKLDGTDHLYSPPGNAGNHPYWDSKLFDYGKPEVQHFLLSNLKYWLEEFHFDGFRFDGVTSMLYTHHGHTEFTDPFQYFSPDVQPTALTYLTLANQLVHEIRPAAITIAEEVSGMPALCYPICEGGVGFDYRLAMAIPDFWIKLLKEVPDQEWDIWEMWKIMTNRLPDVPTIAYCESHDQALVGDQTLAFRLMNQTMYQEMNRASQSLVIERGIALHKMIRLFTIILGGEAYLNFMGNEFGHPEWIDFPRAENGWSYQYARRQWSLASNPFLRYSQLNRFDQEMIRLVKKHPILHAGYAYNLLMDPEYKTIVCCHDSLLFIFNWHPDRAIPDYEIPVQEPGKYQILLSTDECRFGGRERIDKTIRAFTYPRLQADGSIRHFLNVYNLNRNALVLKRIN